MKAKRVEESTWLLVFDRGDEFVEVLTAWATEVRCAHFQAIGAFERATLAYWNPATLQYEDLPVHEQVEVVSLTGDIALGDQGKPRVHAHAALGRRDGSLVGGHLKSGVVMPTIELFLTRGDVDVHRRIDARTGLSLIEL